MNKNPVKLYFDNSSRNYHQNFKLKKSSKNFLFRKRRNLVLEKLKNQEGSFIDIATGSGEITSKIIKNNNFKKITLVDISNKMLEQTKNKISLKKNIQFLNCDFSKKNFNFKYDYIACLGILAHFSNTKNFFKKIKLLSKKNSIIILQSSLSEFFTNRINKIFLSQRYENKFNYKINYLTENEIKKMIYANGFKLITIEKYGLSIPIIDRIFPSLNFYLEKLFEKFFKSSGCEAIFIIKKK